jgi:ADP-ribose pyrophosphatase YjhB (NUDIX family)
MAWLTDEEYKFIFSKVPRLCIDFLIETPEGIFLARRNIEPFKGLFSLPGGKVNYKESLEDATQRIFKKELGTSAKIIDRNAGNIEFLENGEYLHSVSIVFLVEPVGEIKLNDKEADAIIFANSKTDKNIIHPQQREFLEKIGKI